MEYCRENTWLPAGRCDAEHGGRSAVEHDPVLHTIRFEECLPALLAHSIDLGC